MVPTLVLLSDREQQIIQRETMITLTIYGVDYCNTAQLTTELQTINPAVSLVTYTPADSNRVDIQLSGESMTGDEERALRNQVNVHSSARAQVAASALLTRQANETSANTDYLLSPFAGKTPAQIASYFNTQIDGLAWATIPAAVRADLKRWLTTLAIIASKFENREV